MRCTAIIALLTMVGCRERDEPPRQITLALTGPSQPDPLSGVERLRVVAHANTADVDEEIELDGGSLILDTLVPADTRYVTVLALGPGGEKLAAGSSRELEMLTDGLEVSVLIARIDEVSSIASALVTPRSGHCSARLDPSRVALLGGMTQGGGVTNTSEVFDATTGSSTLGPALPFSPDQCVAAGDGRVLATDAGTSSNLLVVDFAAGTARQVAGCGAARTATALVALPSSRFAVVGGNDGSGDPLAEVQIVELAGDSTSCVGSIALDVARSSPQAVSLADGRILVGGGSDDAGATVVRVELIDAVRLVHGPSADGPLATDIVLAANAAGSVVQLYNDGGAAPAAGLWLVGSAGLAFRDLPDAPATWSRSRAVLAADSGLWISGGTPSRLEHLSRLTFETMGDMRTVSSGHTLDCVGFGGLAAVGGVASDGTTTLTTAEWFQQLPATPMSRPDISRGFDDERWWRGWELHDPTLWTLREGDPGSRFALGILGNPAVERAGLDELAILGQDVARPFVMEIDVAAIGSGAAAAVVARYCDPANYVYLGFDADGAHVTAYAVQDSVRTALGASLTLSRAGLIGYRHVAVQDGDTLTFAVDEDSLAVEAPAMRCRNARVGFGADTPTDGAIFDNIRVTRSFPD